MIVSSDYSQFVHRYSDQVINKIKSVDDVYDYVELIKLLIQDLQAVLTTRKSSKQKIESLPANPSNLSSVVESQAISEARQLDRKRLLNIKIAKDYKEMIKLLEIEIKQKQEILRVYESRLRVLSGDQQLQSDTSGIESQYSHLIHSISLRKRTEQTQQLRPSSKEKREKPPYSESSPFKHRQRLVNNLSEKRKRGSANQNETSNDHTLEKSACRKFEYSNSRLETDGPVCSVSKRSKKGALVSYCKKATSKVMKRGLSGGGKLSPEQSNSLKHINKATTGHVYHYEKSQLKPLDSSMHQYLTHSSQSPYVNCLIRNLVGSRHNLSQNVGQSLNDRNKKTRKKLSCASGYLRTNRSNSPK